MLLRIGVHVGDIIIDGDDIYGDGVNIAARLEGIAETGGICISRQAYDQVEGKAASYVSAAWPTEIEEHPEAVEVYAIDRRSRGVWTCRPRPDGIEGRLLPCIRRRAPRLCDCGSGPPLVKTANWMNHVEYDWEESSITRHFFVRACAGLHAPPLRCTRQWAV
jgi:Adenylate cyclase, family 3 (some proteins contain HAMP domain)